MATEFENVYDYTLFATSIESEWDEGTIIVSYWDDKKPGVGIGLKIPFVNPTTPNVGLSASAARAIADALNNAADIIDDIIERNAKLTSNNE